MNIEAIAPSVGPSDETLLNAQYGAIPRETFYTGRWKMQVFWWQTDAPGMALRFSVKFLVT